MSGMQNGHEFLETDIELAAWALILWQDRRSLGIDPGNSSFKY